MIYDLGVVHFTKESSSVHAALTYFMPLKGEEYLYSSDKHSDISKR